MNPLYEPKGVVNIIKDVYTMPFLRMYNPEGRDEDECNVEVEETTEKGNANRWDNTGCPTGMFVFLGQPNEDEMNLLWHLCRPLGLCDLE